MLGRIGSAARSSNEGERGGHAGACALLVGAVTAGTIGTIASCAAGAPRGSAPTPARPAAPRALPSASATPRPEIPETPPDAPDAVKKVQVGRDVVCTLMGSGRLLCSGDCKKWQVLEEGVIDFGLRYTLLCALLPDGLTRCWFRGHHGSYPKKHQGRPSTSSLVVGVMDACSTDSSGRYDCVRLDRAGMTPWPQWTDAKYRPPPEPKHDDLIAMDVSFKYACAVRKNGEVWCAGDNYNGQLGSSGGPGQSSSTYLRVPGVTNAVAVAVGTTFTCSLRGSGELVCWGERVWAPGQFRPMVPPSIVSGVGVVTRLAADFGPICALSTDGRITCLGSPWGPKRLIAHDPNFASIAAGGDNVCALTTDGTVHCWSAYGGLPKSCTSGAEPELDAATPGGER